MGKQNPDDARFCVYCSTPFIQNAEQELEISWDYCQITWDGNSNFWLGGWDNVYFWADAIGKDGSYSAGSSRSYRISAYLAGRPPFGIKDGDRKKATDALNELTNILLKDGWEPVEGRGKEVW